MSSREGYRINGSTVEEITRSLSFHLASIANRLDRIEGIRGLSTVESDLDLTGHTILNGTNIPTQSLDPADNPEFSGLTISSGVIKITDSNGTVIHQMSGP